MNDLRLNNNYLSLLTLSYTVIIVLANWFDPRLVTLFGINTDAGTLVFPFTFLLSDLITEVYGFKHARRAVWYGFLFNIVFILYGQLIIHLPSPSYYDTAAFDQILTTNFRIILASIVSYLCAEPLNSMLMAKLKIKLQGRYLGVRYVASSFFAAGVDSVIFSSIAFYQTIATPHLINLILSMWLIKVGIEIVGLPFSITLANKLKQRDQLDIYDRNTNFNLFNFDVNYRASANEFMPT